ncbi:MAG: zf-HC2 domain-containing protein [Proteobacteria bacterium]|nr:zf-HC2 domain-containing protein [Pseudomonadota bacterium]
MSEDLDVGACDSEAARLLPWYATGRLGAAESERVGRHLEHCGICRADLAHEQAVRSALRADGTIEYAPQAGLAKTLARINELGREPDAAAGAPPAAAARRAGTTRWLAAAVVVQAVGLGLLGSALYARHSPPAGEYETLSAPAGAAAGPRVRTVFDPSMPLGELRGLLATHSLVIVDGPSDAGALTLAATRPTDPGALLAGLRADRRVLFAEPTGRDPGGAR